MPAAVESSKGRAKLFNTLDRSGAHFISVGSGSSSDSEGNDSEDGGEQGSEIRATQGGGKKAKAKLDRSRQKQKQKQSTPPPPHSPCDGGEVPGSGESGSVMSVRYSRVTSGDGPSSSSPMSEAEHSKRRRSQLAERISNKLHALLWVVVGIAVAYRTDFVRVLVEDDRVNRIWFNIAAICFSVNVVILAYLTVWLPHVRGVKVSWNVYCPRAIPTATAVGLICALTLNAALWNVWGFLTPLILFAVFTGCLFSLHFVPWPC